MKNRHWKAFIRVVKSLTKYEFGSTDVVREPFIEAESKDEVKRILAKRYPQFFPDGKVYCREAKDEAQFFYVVIYPLYEYELELIKKGSWMCEHCEQVYENAYVNRPYVRENITGSLKFCRSEDSHCFESYLKDRYSEFGVDMPDDRAYIKTDSPSCIYKITEKETDKSYIGKTKNAPFFRWWNHLTHSKSPFGIYLRSTKLSDWTFEVLVELPSEIEDVEVFRIETEFIQKYDSINNGFNVVVSNKKAVTIEDELQPSLFQ